MREGTKMQERRANLRHVEKGCVAVTILSAATDRALEGQTLFCRTGDISVDGLSFDAYSQIPTGATLELNVQLAGPIEQLRHTGRVQRCAVPRRDACRAYRIGVKLEASSGSRGTAWREVINRRRSLLTGSKGDACSGDGRAATGVQRSRQ